MLETDHEGLWCVNFSFSLLFWLIKCSFLNGSILDIWDKANTPNLWLDSPSSSWESLPNTEKKKKDCCDNCDTFNLLIFIESASIWAVSKYARFMQMYVY